jgi:hypothetical protein
LPGMDIVTDMVISAFARTYGFKITQEELPTS